jgi:hypothetical protein
MMARREGLAGLPGARRRVFGQATVMGDQPGRRRVLGKILIEAHQALPGALIQAGFKFLSEDPRQLLALDLFQDPPDEQTGGQPHHNGDKGHGHATQQAKEDGFEIDANHGPALMAGYPARSSARGGYSPRSVGAQSGPREPTLAARGGGGGVANGQEDPWA